MRLSFFETPVCSHIEIAYIAQSYFYKYDRLESIYDLFQQVKEEEDAEKLHLAQNCKIFKDWPVHSLKKVSETFTWFKIPARESKSNFDK